MPMPEQNKPYYQQDPLERAESTFANKENVNHNDLMQVVVVAQVESGLDRYRAEAGDMTAKHLRDEAHQSQRLAKHLEEKGDYKPHTQCHAHAIVSGAHRNAAPMRAIMARQKVRIDDSHNGCWLPENTAALTKMPRRLRSAVPHSRIHRYNYYFWLNSLINFSKTHTSDDLRYTLQTIGLQLQAGTQPSYVMNKKGEGLPS